MVYTVSNLQSPYNTHINTNTVTSLHHSIIRYGYLTAEIDMTLNGLQFSYFQTFYLRTLNWKLCNITTQ